MEGYHVSATHPQLHALTAPEMRAYGPDHPDDTPRARSESARDYVDTTISHFVKLSEGMAGMVDAHEVTILESLRDMDLPDDIGPAAMAFYTRVREEITTQGRARGLPVPDLVELAATVPFKAVEFLFPHYFLLPMFSAMSSYRVRPLTPETCLFELWSLAMIPDDPAREVPAAPEPIPHDDTGFPEIPRQDYSNLPSQQLGLHAKGFEFMRIQPETEGMISNYQRLIDGYLAGLPPELLARATAAVGSGFDAPVLDIGF